MTASEVYPSSGPNLRVLAYAVSLAAIAAGLAGWLITRDESFASVWVVIPLAFLGAAAERHSVTITGNLEVSIALLPMLFAAVVLGPLPAMCVGAASMLGGFRSPYLRWAVYTSTSAINGAAVGLAATWAAGLTASELLSSAQYAPRLSTLLSRPQPLRFAEQGRCQVS
jgi:hypothetical protein